MLGIYGLSCNHSANRHQPAGSAKVLSVSAKDSALKIAEEIAFRTYGNVIKNELPLKGRLSGDSVWIVEGTLPEGADGGTVYIELSKRDYKLLKLTHYK
ncbi:NTF2 fold immunity protein [Niastella yeongjuensis]|nr:NTF2 fold immunity protein [Niastella yeongjuensis]